LFLFISFRASLRRYKFYINKFSFLYSYSAYREVECEAHGFANPRCFASHWRSNAKRMASLASEARGFAHRNADGFAK
jgi:hypothetical protein